MASSDLGTRFIGGLLGTNLIQYWEYSRNMTTLREKIYPFVKDNAEFYLSYVVMIEPCCAPLLLQTMALSPNDSLGHSMTWIIMTWITCWLLRYQLHSVSV